ncbi:hypothetical protein U3516DRAFT_758789 [Neocallimastix sp. 'constans']
MGFICPEYKRDIFADGSYLDAALYQNQFKTSLKPHPKQQYFEYFSTKPSPKLHTSPNASDSCFILKNHTKLMSKIIIKPSKKTVSKPNCIKMNSYHPHYVHHCNKLAIYDAIYFKLANNKLTYAIMQLLCDILIYKLTAFDNDAITPIYLTKKKILVVNLFNDISVFDLSEMQCNAFHSTHNSAIHACSFVLHAHRVCMKYATMMMHIPIHSIHSLHNIACYMMCCFIAFM